MAVRVGRLGCGQKYVEHRGAAVRTTRRRDHENHAYCQHRRCRPLINLLYHRHAIIGQLQVEGEKMGSSAGGGPDEMLVKRIEDDLLESSRR